MVAIDPGAERIAREFAREVEATAPGLVERVHITGSAITNDWRSGRSDVDVVILTSRTATANELAALERLHRRFAAVDALFLTEEQLAAGPDAVTQAPQAIAGSFSAAKAGAQLTWVTWLELEAGATLDAAPVAPFFADTAARAAEASRRNLREYWLPLGRMAAIKFAALGPSANDIVWMALGPPRLVATIEQGSIISKSQAGEFAAREWPEFADVIGRAVHYRATGEGSFGRRDARETLQLLRQCAERGTRYS